jgi:hypothetical protein
VADGEIAHECRGEAGRLAIDRDRFDPVDDVLQPQVRSRRLRDVERRPRVGWFGADVEEQRALRLEHTGGAGDPVVRPRQIVRLAQRIFVLVVADAEVVGRRRHDDVDALRRQMTKNVTAV